MHNQLPKRFHCFLVFLPITLALFAVSSHVFGGAFFVTNEKDNTVSVIDDQNFTVTETFEVGLRPRGITVTGDFSKLLICASDDNSVQVYDVKTRKRLYDLPSGDDPEQFYLHPDNRRLFIANEEDSVTTIVDIQTRKVLGQVEVGVEPEGMAVSHDGKMAITTSETTNMAHWIDTATYEIFDNTPVDIRPRYARFTKDDSELWVSSEIGGTVTVIGLPSRTVLRTVRFEIPGIRSEKIQPVGFEFNADDSLVYVALGPSNRVATVNRRTGKPEKYIPVGRRVWHMAFRADYAYLVTTNGVSNDITVIDTKQNKAIKSVVVGRYPWGIVHVP